MKNEIVRCSGFSIGVIVSGIFFDIQPLTIAFVIGSFIYGFYRGHTTKGDK